MYIQIKIKLPIYLRISNKTILITILRYNLILHHIIPIMKSRDIIVRVYNIYDKHDIKKILSSLHRDNKNITRYIR